MASGAYLAGAAAFYAGSVDYDANTIKVALTTSSYTPNLDVHDFFDDVTNEVVGTGYSAGGATLGSKTNTTTAANSWATTWAANTAYAVNKIVRPTSGNGYVYRCVTAGTSHGSTEPTWPTTVGDTVTDNGVKWVNFGRAVVTLDAADPSWASATITARYAVIYAYSGSAATSQLLWLEDFGSNVTSTNGTFTVQFDAQGILNLGVA